jgi:hypothetical protein
LRNLIGVRKASLDLLSKLGVQLTDRSRTALGQAASSERVKAQTNLAQGLTAQRQGTVVDALVNYYRAEFSDPTLFEAAIRAKSVIPAVTSKSLGDNIRNDIAWRDEWVKIIEEARVYFEVNPPYIVYINPKIYQRGEIDYSTQTVTLACNALVVADTVAWQVIYELASGLEKTGRAEAWGLLNFFGKLKFSDYTRVFSGVSAPANFTVRLVNDQGKVLKALVVKLFDSSDRSVGVYWDGSLCRVDFIPFKGIKADDITDNLTLSVGGENPYVTGDNIPVFLTDLSLEGSREVGGYFVKGDARGLIVSLPASEFKDIKNMRYKKRVKYMERIVSSVPPFMGPLKVYMVDANLDTNQLYSWHYQDGKWECEILKQYGVKYR